MTTIVDGTTGITFPSAIAGVSATQQYSGRVLQVVSTTLTTAFSTTSGSMVDVTGLSLSITPTSATSKVLITVNLTMTPGASGAVLFYQMVRNSTAIGIGTTGGANGGSGIVIIRYADSFDAAIATTGSPTITVAGGYRVYKWTSSGTITF